MQFRFIFKFVLPFALLAAALVWAREKTGSACEAAATIGRHLPRATSWLTEAGQDPFLARQMDRPRLRSALKQFQAAAAIARSDFGLLRLEAGTKQQLSVFAEARGNEALVRAARAIDLQPILSRCASAPGPREQAFLRQLDDATAEWEEARRAAAQDKLEFANDRDIFCQIDSLRAGLEQVLQTTRTRCAERAVNASACASSGSGAAVQRELRDLNEKREFNLTKMQRKWPAAAVENIKCVPASI